MTGRVFWKIVKNEVARQKTSFEWLYYKTGISKGTFSSWKNRQIIPRADEAYKIAAVLHVSVEYLLTGSDRTKTRSNPCLQEIIETLIGLDAPDLKAVSALTQALATRHAKKP
ncbi:MAG: helix-turn-helix domain-containing protein [Candidatus Margulisbacteria bacterium]|jgi:transcriptional regulator with XRE-family HTH domain|nr:helix-turn-helix domain-containing protein [Candidatus Margulisiibacteriota bacterium]